jgi:hypothetical protein
MWSVFTQHFVVVPVRFAWQIVWGAKNGHAEKIGGSSVILKDGFPRKWSCGECNYSPQLHKKILLGLNFHNQLAYCEYTAWLKTVENNTGFILLPARSLCLRLQK